MEKRAFTFSNYQIPRDTISPRSPRSLGRHPHEATRQSLPMVFLELTFSTVDETRSSFHQFLDGSGGVLCMPDAGRAGF
eukprot:3990923-Amphidinium_carterae.1